MYNQVEQVPKQAADLGFSVSLQMNKNLKPHKPFTGNFCQSYITGADLMEKSALHYQTAGTWHSLQQVTFNTFLIFIPAFHMKEVFLFI